MANRDLGSRGFTRAMQEQEKPSAIRSEKRHQPYPGALHEKALAEEGGVTHVGGSAMDVKGVRGRPSSPRAEQEGKVEVEHTPPEQHQERRARLDATD